MAALRPHCSDRHGALLFGPNISRWLKTHALVTQHTHAHTHTVHACDDMYKVRDTRALLSYLIIFKHRR